MRGGWWDVVYWLTVGAGIFASIGLMIYEIADDARRYTRHQGVRLGAGVEFRITCDGRGSWRLDEPEAWNKAPTANEHDHPVPAGGVAVGHTRKPAWLVVSSFDGCQIFEGAAL